MPNNMIMTRFATKCKNCGTIIKQGEMIEHLVNQKAALCLNCSSEKSRSNIDKDDLLSDSLTYKTSLWRFKEKFFKEYQISNDIFLFLDVFTKTAKTPSWFSIDSYRNELRQHRTIIACMVSLYNIFNNFRSYISIQTPFKDVASLYQLMYDLFKKIEPEYENIEEDHFTNEYIKINKPPSDFKIDFNKPINVLCDNNIVIFLNVQFSEMQRNELVFRLKQIAPHCILLYFSD